MAAVYLQRLLGRSLRHPTRLYLVGGTTLVYEQLRGATLDWADVKAQLPERGWSQTEIAEYEANVALVLGHGE